MIKPKKEQVARETLKKEISVKTGVSQQVVDSVITSFFELIHTHLEEDHEMVFRPWGKFTRRIKQSRSYVDPLGKRVTSPGKAVVAWQPFRSGKKIL